MRGFRHVIQEVNRKGLRPSRTHSDALNRRPDGSHTHLAHVLIATRYDLTAAYTRALDWARPGATTHSTVSSRAHMRTRAIAAARPTRTPKARRLLACSSAVVAARHRKPHARGSRQRDKDPREARARADAESENEVRCLARRPRRTRLTNVRGSGPPRALARPSGDGPRTRFECTT